MKVTFRVLANDVGRNALIAACVLCVPVLSHGKTGPDSATAGPFHTVTAVQQDTSQKQQVALSHGYAGQAGVETESFVKPGEAIRIYAFPDTTSFINGFYPVDGKGRIYLPIIGKMDVSGMSEKAFLDTIKAQYINYLRYPNLQVRRLIRVSLLGGFLRPGLYYIDPDYSLWDAVNYTGGTLRDDGLLRMRWERDRKIVSKDIIPFFQSGQPLSSIGFRSGDQLCTPGEPKSSWWEVVVKDIVLSQVLPAVTTGASLYISYIMYKTYKNR